MEVSYPPKLLSFVIYKLDDFFLLKCHQKSDESGVGEIKKVESFEEI